MSAVTLTEQMGAMALIDELRHAQLEVQKHLDLPARRQAVADRIREYYKSKGIAVDDALVDQGVKAYFASRLTYEAPKVGALQGLLARVYTTRAKWGLPAGVALALSISLFLGGNYALQRHQQYLVDRTEALVEAASVGAEHIQSQLKSQKLAIVQLEASLSKSDPISVRRLVERVRMSFPQVDGIDWVTLPKHVTPENREEAEAQVEDSRRQQDEALALLKANDRMISSVPLVREANMRLLRITSQPGYAAAAESTPRIRALASSARTVIDTADQGNSNTSITNTLDRLSVLMNSYQDLEPRRDKLAKLRQQVGAMGLSQADLAQFDPIFSRIQEALTDLDGAFADEMLRKASAVQAYAAKPLTLGVVSRAHEKSMVERNYDPTGGKSWYLLTEATDAAGNVVPVPVISAETGRKTMAKVFGVRVEEATYRLAYKDKKADGRVDDREMGHKPANSFSLNFNSNRAVVGRPDLITEW